MIHPDRDDSSVKLGADASGYWWYVSTIVLAAGLGALAGLNLWLGLIPLGLAGVALLIFAVSRRQPGFSRSDLKAQGETWGGRAVLLLTTSVVASSFLSRVVDGASLRLDNEGARYLVAGGSFGRNAGFVFVALAVLCTWPTVLRAVREPVEVGSGYSRWMLALIGWWVACSLVFRLQLPDVMGFVEAVAALAIAVTVVIDPPNRRTLVRLTHLLNFTVVSMLAFGLANFSQQLPCRPDKCGIFGNLFVGYLFHENSAARLVVLLIPVAWAVPSRLYLAFTLVSSGVLIAATGSRTSYLTYGVALAVVIAVRWTQRNGRRDIIKVSRLIRAVPLAVLLASLVLFLFVPSSALTGRGAVYAALREFLTGWYLVVGPGPNTVSELQLGFQLGGEHGQASHLLTQAGVVGLALFTAAMAALMFGSRWTLLQASGFGLVLVASTQFATEELELSTRTISYVVIVLSIGLLSGRRWINGTAEESLSHQQAETHTA